ncbi:MAG: penicillin-binding protein 2 [Nitrospirae bacterium]|nr:penicillin-binding protein 2 [Nitrospirota bacterium]MBI3605439.1 penicillin-binding protein 2 [Nitrospirota bacterium]
MTPARTERKKTGCPYFSRIGVIVAFFFLGLGLLTFRLVYLQLFITQNLSKIAVRQHQKTIVIQGERGRILDRNGRILAANLEVPSLYAVPPMIKTPGSVAEELSLIVNEPRPLILEKLKGDKSFVWIKRKITPEVSTAIENLGVEGVGMMMGPERFYPKKHLMGHILGFVGSENQGLEGIEKQYDGVLQGKKASVTLERDARGEDIFPKDLNYHFPKKGEDLYVTIDEVIQYISEKELDAMMKESGAESGAVIVIEPGTGDILAWVVRPDFNPNSISAYSPSDWRNRGITDVYEPGSTFKIVTAAAALEEKTVFPSDVIYCENGSFAIDGKTIHDHTREGMLTFSQVIQKSSNIGTAKVALRLGEDKLRHYIQAFGFGSKTGIDLNGEMSGIVNASRHLPKRTLASISIGQGIAVTPLQMAAAFSVIANGGVFVKPRVVRGVLDEKGGVSRGESEKPRRVISERTAREVTRILQTVVHPGGTGEKAALSGYIVAGKTGTAQTVDSETHTYSADQYIGSFGGFVPADDPRLVILVVINHPKGVSWGGSVAAPVFRNIAGQTLNYLGIPPFDTKRMLVVQREP